MHKAIAAKESSENPRPEDEWDHSHDVEVDADVSSPKHKSKEGKKISGKLGDGLNKTKEGASKSMRKVKEGASVGVFWMKDKFRKPAHKNTSSTPPPPPPPSDSP